MDVLIPLAVTGGIFAIWFTSMVAAYRTDKTPLVIVTCSILASFAYFGGAQPVSQHWLGYALWFGLAFLAHMIGKRRRQAARAAAEFAAFRASTQKPN